MQTTVNLQVFFSIRLQPQKQISLMINIPHKNFLVLPTNT